MERKGGCCLAPRYGAAAAAAAAQQQAGAAWQMGRIMLKFRPIAPKPAAMALAPAQTPVAGPTVGAAGRGGKRKAVCGGGGRRGRMPKKAATAAVVSAAPAAAQDAGDCRKHCDKDKSSSSRSSSSSGMTSVDSSPPPPGPQQYQLATLPLMPVVTPVEDKAAAGAATEEPPTPVSSQVAAAPAAGAGAGARPFAPRAIRPGPAAAASLVMVEEVTATWWRDGEALPSSAACVGSGADDEAPAFVSDQWGRVTWMNAAFVRAVSADVDGDEAEAPPVALGGSLPAWGTCAGFTCRVRVVRHSSPRRVGSSSVVAPCDVWRLDAGGSYLWRLDLQAALTLGVRMWKAIDTRAKLGTCKLSIA